MVKLKRKPRGRLVEGAKGAVSWMDGTEGDAFYSRRAAYIRAIENGKEVWYRDRDLTDAEVAALGPPPAPRQGPHLPPSLYFQLVSRSVGNE